MARKICNILIELGIIALIIFPPIFFGAVLPRHITYIQLLILGLLSIWFVKAFVKGSLTYISTPFDLPIILFFLLSGMNLLTSTYAHNTEQTLYLWLNYTLLYLLVVHHLRTLRRIIGLAFIMVLIGTGESLFGLFQYLQGAKTVLGYATPNIGTVNATYFSHNHFAGFLILIIPIAFGLLLGTVNLEKKFFLLLLAGVMGAALVLSLSRGGLLSFGIACTGFGICFLIKQSSQSGFWKTFGIVLVVLLLGIICFVVLIGESPIAHRSLLETFLPRRATIEQEIRFPLWRNALKLVKESPIFGSGLGTFQYVFLRYRPPELPQDQQAFYAHNDYIELLVEMGIPALLIMVFAIVQMYRHGFRAYFSHSDQLLTSLTLGGLTSCAAMLIHCFFDFNLQIPANALLFCLVLAMTTATIQRMNQGQGRRRRKRRKKESEISEAASSQYQGKRQIKTSWKILVPCIAIIVVLGIHFRTPLASHYYSKAKTFQNLKQPFAAIPWYHKAIRIDSGNALFYESLGQLYYEFGKTAPHAEKWYLLAVQEFQQAIALNPYQAISYYHLGWAYDALEMEKEAVQAFQSAIDHNPRIAFYYENLGKYFLAIDQTTAALKRLQKALELDPQKMPEILKICHEYTLSYETYQHVIPETAGSRKAFAHLLAQQGNWKASKTEYHKAIELSEKQPEYYGAMLEACRQRQDYPCMRALWSELGQQYPDTPEYAIKAAESFVQQQALEQAIELYQTIVLEHPDEIAVHSRLAQLYQQQERHDDALQLYRQLLAQHPDKTDLYHDLVRLYQQQEQWNAAIEVYETALANGFTQAAIYSALGRLYSQIDEQGKALEMYEYAIQAGETQIGVYQRVEQMYQKQKRTLDAEFLWETYIVTNKQTPESLFQLAKHYHMQGEWLKAVNLAKEVIATAPTNADYRKFLANLYEQKGMLFETIEQWEKVVNMKSGNIAYRLHLAGLYERVEDWKNARLQYQNILKLQPDHPQAQQKLLHLGG